MATAIRCYDCREFFSIKQPACESCGAPRRGRNAYLETAKLNNNLYAQAESAVAERKLGEHVARGGQAPVTPAHREMARQLMDHL